MAQDSKLHAIAPKLDVALYQQLKLLALLHHRTIAEELNAAMAEYVGKHTITLN